MGVKELKLDGGLNDLRLNDVKSGDGNYLAFTIETRKSFKGDIPTSSMLAMLDRGQQHLLLLYLKERLG